MRKTKGVSSNAKKAKRLMRTSRRVVPRKSGKENGLLPDLGIVENRVNGGAGRCHWGQAIRDFAPRSAGFDNRRNPALVPFWAKGERPAHEPAVAPVPVWSDW